MNTKVRANFFNALPDRYYGIGEEQTFDDLLREADSVYAELAQNPEGQWHSALTSLLDLMMLGPNMNSDKHFILNQFAYKAVQYIRNIRKRIRNPKWSDVHGH